MPQFGLGTWLRWVSTIFANFRVGFQFRASFNIFYSVTRVKSEKLSSMQSAKDIETLMLHGFMETKVKLVKPSKPRSMMELSKEKIFLLQPRNAYITWNLKWVRFDGGFQNLTQVFEGFISFVSKSKLWNTFHKPKDVAHACELSLKNLRVDVIGELFHIRNKLMIEPGENWDDNFQICTLCTSPLHSLEMRTSPLNGIKTIHEKSRLGFKIVPDLPVRMNQCKTLFKTEKASLDWGCWLC